MLKGFWGVVDYVTPGRGKSTKEVLKRIDYGGCMAMFVAVRLCQATMD